jgi:hypothetical protein
VGGLTNGDAYTFAVTATNVVGSSAPSNKSNTVTPTPPLPTVTKVRPAAGRMGTKVIITGTGLRTRSHGLFRHHPGHPHQLSLIDHLDGDGAGRHRDG